MHTDTKIPTGLIPERQAYSAEFVDLDNTLLNEAREYRAEEKYGDALSFANSLANGIKIDSAHRITYRKSVEQVADGGTYSADIHLNSPHDRSYLNAFGVAAGLPKDGIFEIFKAANTEGAQDQLQIGEGISFGINTIEGSTDTYGYYIKVDNTVSLEERTKSLTTFLERAAGVVEQTNNQSDEIIEQLDNGTTEAYGSESFDFAHDYEELLAFIQSSSIQVPGIEGSGDARGKQKLFDKLYNMPAHYEGDQLRDQQTKEGIYFDETGAIKKILILTQKPGVYLALKSADIGNPADLSELSLQFGIELSIPEIYLEKSYNSDREEGVDPFIETQTAAECLALFEASELKPQSRIVNAFSEVGALEKRYGHGYAEITRELAKLVNNKGRLISNFFEGDNDDEIKEKLEKLESGSVLPSTQIVIDLLRGIVNRDAQPGDGVTELVATKNKIQIRDGSCKDIEVYIADSNYAPVVDETGEPLMLQSSFHRPTFVSLKPTLLNGVLLPKGSLLCQEEDGFAFMRITSFALGKEEARTVFGAQELENSRTNGYEYNSSRIREIMA